MASWVAQGGYLDDKHWDSKEMTWIKCDPFPRQYLGTIHTVIIDGRLSKESAIEIANKAFAKMKFQKADMFAISKGDFKRCLDLNDEMFTSNKNLIQVRR